MERKDLLVAKLCLLRRTGEVENVVVARLTLQSATIGYASCAGVLRAFVCNQADAKVAARVANGEVCIGACTATDRPRVEANVTGATAICANVTASIAGRVLAAFVIARTDVANTGHASDRACPQRGYLDAIGKRSAFT
jgi:hypothetical protein